jgi:hypothetical protein
VLLGDIRDKAMVAVELLADGAIPAGPPADELVEHVICALAVMDDRQGLAHAIDRLHPPAQGLQSSAICPHALNGPCCRLILDTMGVPPCSPAGQAPGASGQG